jgi:hypothetical protein
MIIYKSGVAQLIHSVMLVSLNNILGVVISYSLNKISARLNNK